LQKESIKFNLYSLDHLKFRLAFETFLFQIFKACSAMKWDWEWTKDLNWFSLFEWKFFSVELNYFFPTEIVKTTNGPLVFFGSQCHVDYINESKSVWLVKQKKINDSDSAYRLKQMKHLLTKWSLILPPVFIFFSIRS
jgi:hypothetical protein